ncbi:MAG: SDR family oxidoreductase [Verrucomicrobia bacterium]|nr:SDR family oxidoreductase [Verrucomicrobiota bacterium]
MDVQLKDKTVLITGAFGGFGRALVAGFLREGAHVIAAGRQSPPEAQPQLAAFATPPAYVTCDYRRPETIAAAVAATSPDIVIANAGVTHPVNITDATLAEWNDVIAVNLTGNFLLGQASARHMAARGGGVILFIGSWAQNLPQPNIGAYSPSKAGMKMMALCLAKEMAPRGVRINLLSPGIIDSGMAARQMERQPERRARAEKVTRCGRLGTAEEIADACLFLCSPRAGFIYGADLTIDGGASLGVI